MVFQTKYDRLRRLRLHFPRLDGKRLHGLQTTVDGLEGVMVCEANYVTNTLTVCYDEGYREKILDFLSGLRHEDVPIGSFNSGMIKKDFFQKTVTNYGKKMILSAIFPGIMKAGKVFR